MAKVSEIVSLVVFIGLWHTISGQNSCWNNPCACCKNNKCDTSNNNRCTDGCIDGFWDRRCYSKCPSNCATCTHGSNNQGYPCTSCIAGKYNSYWCNYNCRSRCVSCTGRDNCDKCVDGRYGTSCEAKCYSECEDGVCDKKDGKCTCKAGYTSSFCKQCAPNEFGQYPDCVTCPDKCLTCSSNTECTKCVAGQYGSICMNNCSTLCKDSLCDLDGSCIACPDGNYNSGCQTACPEQCKTCVSANNCTTCMSGLFGVLCNEICPENCMDCTSLTSCQACKPGFKGIHCQDECTNCKRGTNCNQINGRCDTCKYGKYGDSCTSNCYYSDCLACQRNNRFACTECKSGKYSLTNQCKFNCPWNNCLDNTCDAIHGTCPVCKDDFHGTYCRCPANCQTCNTNGYCQSCIDDYVNTDKQCECRKDKCSIPGCDKCTDTTWYPDVSSQSCCQCSSNCKGGQCVSGTECASGCEDGYYGNACDKLCSDLDNNCLQCTIDGNDNYHNCSKCSQGYYLESNICQVCNSNCKNTNCDQSTGQCLDGCKIGIWGEKCESFCSENCLTCNQVTGVCEVCKNGKYTTDCSVSCSANCTVLDGEGLKCRINDGACLDGCISTKLYGLLCNEDCSSNCTNSDCDWQTEKCFACVANKYGPKCGNECSKNCVTNEQDGQLTRCYGENGTCTVGCISGFHGLKCEYSCSQYCSNTTCGRLNGECLHGCMEGYTGGTCTQALANNEPIKKSWTGAVIGGAVSGIVVVVLIVIAVAFLVRKRCGTKDNANTAHNYKNTRHEGNNSSMVITLGPDGETSHEYEELDEVPQKIQPSALEVETNHEYEKPDEVPHHMQSPGFTADHDGDGVVMETENVTYEPLKRTEMNTDIYSQLEKSAYENTTI